MKPNFIQKVSNWGNYPIVEVEMKSEEVNIILPKEDQEVVDTNKEIELKSETSVSKKSTPKRIVKKK